VATIAPISVIPRKWMIRVLKAAPPKTCQWRNYIKEPQARAMHFASDGSRDRLSGARRSAMVDTVRSGEIVANDIEELNYAV
jgi:hypothetical protein